MKIKRSRKLMILELMIFLNISFLLYSSLGKDYLIEDINLKIVSFQNGKRKTCEYKIDKFNNLIYLNTENKFKKKKVVDNEVYYYNYLYNNSLDNDVYKFWLEKEVDLKEDGLYINGEHSLIDIDNDIEKIYLIEYLTKEKKAKVPIILESEYVLGVGNDMKKFKISSKEKKLKDIQYFILYNFMIYVNKLEKCF